MKRILGVVGVALVTSWPTPLAYASGFDSTGSQYTRTLWTARDGLPSHRIVAIAQDRDGFLWLATSAGVTRFDGKRFELGGRLGEALKLRTAAISVAQDGSLWFAFSDSARLGRLQGRQLEIHDMPGPARALMQSRDGTMWAGGVGGLSIFQHGRWQRIEHRFGEYDVTVDALFEDHGGSIWIGTSNGIYRHSKNADELELVLPVPSASPHEFAETAAGDVVVNDPKYLLRHLAGRHPASQANVGVAGAVHVLADRRGNVWLATPTHGLLRFTDYPNGRIERVSPDNGITCLFEDRDGNIWMGTADGLVQLSMARIVSFATTNPSVAPFGSVIATASDGSVWAAAADGVVRFANGKQTSYGTRDGLTGVVTALQGTRDGAMWIGTDEGLLRHVNGRLESFRLPGESVRHLVRSIAIDLEGTVWVSDLQGVFRWKHGQFTPVDVLQRPAYAVRVMYADARGRLWFGLSEGDVAVYERGKIRWYSDKDGLAPAPVISICEDSRGAVWMVTTASISRFENGRFTTLKRGIPGNVFVGLAVDRHDDLWIAVNAGIVRLNRQEFDKAVADPAYQLQTLVYDASDGLVGTPRHAGGNPNAVRSTDGRLWFATTHGVSVLDPEQLQEHRAAPRVIIEEVLADNREIELGEPARLPAGTSVVQVHYTAPAVAAATKVRFRHKLEGFDTDWVSDGDGNQRVLYTNLFPGSYRLRVSASNGGGVWTQPDAVWDFSVAPSFYQTRAFYIACVLLLSVALWTAWQQRLRRVRRQFSMVLSERARVGREIHDTLLQSLVGMALQLDNISTELDSSSESVKTQLQRMRRQVEKCVGEANQSISNLRSPMLESRDFPSVLRQAAEDIIVSSEVDFRFAANMESRRCAPAVEQQLLRIAQEAVTNAIRHGHPMRVQMELSYEASFVRLRISDDGCGFDARTVTRGTDVHWGLTIMRERAQQVGGRLDIVSAPNEGTTVEVLAPFSEKNWVY